VLVLVTLLADEAERRRGALERPADAVGGTAHLEQHEPDLRRPTGHDREHGLVPGGHEEHEAVLPLDEDLVELAPAEPERGLLAEGQQRGAHGAEPVLLERLGERARHRQPVEGHHRGGLDVGGATDELVERGGQAAGAGLGVWRGHRASSGRPCATARARWAPPRRAHRPPHRPTCERA
jgi:hypothetical protein